MLTFSLPGIAQGHAYPCFCTEEELEAKRQKAEEDGSPVAYDGTWRDADPAEVQRRIDAGEPYTYRFKVPKGKVRFVCVEGRQLA
jgi:glutamyl-tRNA synthetase